MSAGMADVIVAHPGHEIRLDDRLWVQVCFGCPWRYRYSDGSGLEAHATHVAEELAKAGYGNVCAEPEAEDYDFGGPDPATVPGSFVRAFTPTPDPLAAALADPEGIDLVKAIHDRKAKA